MGGSHGERHEPLAVLCARFAAPGGYPVEDERMRHLVTRITAEVRAGRRPDELEDEFSELEDLLLQAGFTAGLGSYRTTPPQPSYGQLPGTGNGYPLLEVLVCPRDSCARVEVPDDDPQCRVFGEPLRRLDLNP
nr:hypothetical protein [Streptomyces scabichelini]